MMITFQLMIDFAMLVLIWMVQLLIYPGFKYFETRNLIIWHRKYTANMGLIVAPLMLVQLGIHTYSIIQKTETLALSNFVMVLASWLITFVYFVPLHHKISRGGFQRKDLLNLENYNWLRTAIWTLIFLLDLFEFDIFLL